MEARDLRTVPSETIEFSSLPDSSTKSPRFLFILNPFSGFGTAVFRDLISSEAKRGAPLVEALFPLLHRIGEFERERRGGKLEMLFR